MTQKNLFLISLAKAGNLNPVLLAFKGRTIQSNARGFSQNAILKEVLVLYK